MTRAILVAVLSVLGIVTVMSVARRTCPFATSSPEQVETAHRAGLAQLRGRTTARARPALGLELDRTTTAEAGAWAAARGLDCTPERRGLASLRCLHGDDETLLSFDANGRLISVDTVSKRLNAKQASTAFTKLTAELSSSVGAPSSTVGDPSAVALNAGYARLAAASYRYTNYVASVSAMNLADQGVLIRASYQSVP